MQHAISARLGFLITSLAMSVSAWSLDLEKQWGESDDYVRLESVNADNQHPVTFTVEQLRTVLARFYKKAPNKEPAPYFTDDELKRLAEKLVPVFMKAKPGDDVQFGMSYRPGNFFMVPREINAGRLFVENGHLNMIVGWCAEPFDIGYLQAYGRVKALNHGSRIKPASKLGCDLLAGHGVEYVNNRNDWVRLDIPAALAALPITSFGSASMAQPTFAPATGGSTTTFSASSKAQPAATAPAAPATPVLPAQPASRAEERLQLLKRLRDNGLINAQEYEQKRAAILKEL